ncbi:MAG: DUF4982 domain-containing protein [Bacteroidales bacterium]
MRKRLIYTILLLSLTNIGLAQRQKVTLEKGWKFTKGDVQGAEQSDFNDKAWESVVVPHDWAIYGPFAEENDLQVLAVTQNLEQKASKKTGRTGGLPYMGVGWYRRKLTLTDFDTSTQKAQLIFDGAMSQAQVYINGHKVCFHPYGYATFHCDITPYIYTDGRENTLGVRLENLPQSSRWYPGAGLYRNVHLLVTHKTAVPIWGTQITTPYVSKAYSSVKLQTKIDNALGKEIRIETQILDAQQQVVATAKNRYTIKHQLPIEQNFIVENPALWSPENPQLYQAQTSIYTNNKLVDVYTTTFGIRSIELIPNKGFFLNGEVRKFQGVCNHHDLGPLGAAINVSALRYQLQLLKDMGCDAIRTSHNMPAPELVELCDQMGFMMMVENFDEWDVPKCTNGYHRFFKDWAEKDMIGMLHQYRNNASVVMWSIGNEVPTQCSAEGYKVAKFLQDICMREDPTRPVTCGMDQVSCVLENGFASVVQVVGFNYRTYRYQEAYENLPQQLILGSETASTVSSRGVYKFPAKPKANALYDDNQSSSYDVEYCAWSNIPDEDFALADDHEWTIGQFVWTGFDYLGEPSPYDTDAWPSHSSLFGIIDLASIPKDRYYLYRSIWNTKENTLHILPHWTWAGREGEKTPVFVYSNYHEIELFVNGKTQGRRKKSNETLMNRYRFMWHDVVYEPGELKAIAYDEEGNIKEEKIVKTAGEPYQLKVTANTPTLTADGKDLAYLRVSVVDKQGNPCPHDNRMLHFTVKGAGTYRAAANGDATSLNLFHLPQMPLFKGQLTAIIQSSETAGTISFEVKAKGLKSAKIMIQSTLK